MSIRNLLLIALSLGLLFAPVVAETAAELPAEEPAIETPPEEPGVAEAVEDSGEASAERPGDDASDKAEPEPPAEEPAPPAAEPEPPREEPIPPAEEPPADPPPADPPSEPAPRVKALSWLEISIFSPGLVEYNDHFKARLQATGKTKLRVLRRQVLFVAKFNPDPAIRAKAKQIAEDIKQGRRSS